MKKNLGLPLLALGMCFFGCLSAGAQKKTVVVEPQNAKIFVNGSEVGSGSCTLKFDRRTDFYMLRFEAPGYLDRSVKLYKNNPQNTVSYTLLVDEA